MVDPEQITEPETPDDLPGQLRAAHPAPKTRAEFSNLSLAPRSSSCRDVENVRRLLSWLIKVDPRAWLPRQHVMTIR